MHLIFHFDAGIHYIGFFREFVYLELEHFIFINGAYVISSFGISIQGVGRCMVGSGDIEIGLCSCQIEEQGAGLGRD